MSGRCESKRETVVLAGDLHVFAARSRGLQHWERLPALLQEVKPDHCVLIGDIFDFAWATRHGAEQAIAEAAAMVEALCGGHASIQFHYIFGNHDFHPRFVEKLGQVASQHRHLRCHPVSVQLGGTLFVHGDIADRAALNAETLLHHRRHWAERPVHGALLERLYQMLVALRVDEMGGLLKFFQPLVRRRLLAFARNSSGSGVVDHIVFGHTHRRQIGAAYRGMRLTNAGAPIGRRVYEHVVLEV